MYYKFFASAPDSTKGSSLFLCQQRPLGRHCEQPGLTSMPEHPTIQTDAGTNFTADELQNAAEPMGILVKTVTTETHNRVGKVERSHAIFRRIYEKLKIEIPGIRKEERLSLTFRAINVAIDSTTGISPTAPVFGIHTKLPGVGQARTMAARANKIRECTQVVIQIKARRLIRDSTRPRNSPSMEEVYKVRHLPPGSQVIVYR